MIIPGARAAGSRLVSEMLSESQVQPCGIDLSVREIHSLSDAGEIDFDNSKRRISRSGRMEFAEGRLHLPQGCYKIVYNEYVEIPLDCAGFGYPRSSLLRCGADVRCAVWDPGYHGRSESLLLVHNPHGIVLHKDAKVMQLVFVRLEEEAKKGYEGKYKGENR
jgi:dUTP pyrophosphatase